MIHSTVLQIPIYKKIRDQASSKAEKMGFSSLQEVVRLFLNKIAAGEVDITFEPKIALSPHNDNRYWKMINDIKTGKVKTKTFSNVNSLMGYLKSEH